MIQQKIKASMEQLVGKTLQKFNLACEMMMFSFEEFALHAQCLTRIICEDDILVTEDGCKNLSKDIIKEIDEIEEFMLKFN